MSMILTLLKHATHPHHVQLEGSPQLRRLLARDITLAEYRTLLTRLYGFYAPLEERLAAWPEWRNLRICYEERRKSPRLHWDLTFLGVGPQVIQGLPECEELPEVSSFAQALGCAYVLEGATLGGRIIAPHLAGSLGLAATGGAAFYGTFGDRVGPMWRQFCRALVAYAATHAADAEAITTSACDTFTKLESWIADSP